jgi:hypothetical protein
LPSTRLGPHAGVALPGWTLHGLEVASIASELCLKLIKLLLAVSSEELIDTHVTTTDSDHQFVIHDLGKDLTGAEHILSIANSLERNVKLELVDVLSHQLIDSVTFSGSVLSFWWLWLILSGFFLESSSLKLLSDELCLL